jgi:chemotaxis protein CheX
METDELTQRVPQEVVADLVSMAWQTFVGSELEIVDAVASPDRQQVLCSSIAIGGPWSATVVLYFARSLAFAGTATILGIEPDELEEADVHDTIGELANIVGGNLKGFVSDTDSEWSLSLPVVSEGMQSVPGSRLATEVIFRCGGELLGCQLREHR